MYTLDCSYYSKSFDNVNDLLDDVLQTGMDPNYHIIYINGDTRENTWETAAELLGWS